MSIEEFKNHLRKTGHYFKLNVPGISTPEPAKLEQIETRHGSLEEYLNRVARENNLTTLNVQTKIRNGSSWANKDILLVDTVAVVGAPTTSPTTPTTSPTTSPTTPTTPITSPTTPIIVDTPTSLASILPPVKNEPMADLRTEIENARLATEVKYLKQDNDRLAQKNKELDQKNDKLHEENMQLTREKNTAKDSADLAIQQAQVAALEEKKGGLSGLVEEVMSTHPDNLKLLVGIFRPDHPMLKQSNTPALEGSEKKHTNADAQGFIESIVEMLLTHSVDNIAMITQLVEDFGKQPEYITQIYYQLHPKKETKA